MKALAGLRPAMSPGCATAIATADAAPTPPAISASTEVFEAFIANKAPALRPTEACGFRGHRTSVRCQRRQRRSVHTSVLAIAFPLVPRRCL